MTPDESIIVTKQNGISTSVTMTNSDVLKARRFAEVKIDLKSSMINIKNVLPCAGLNANFLSALNRRGLNVMFKRSRN